MCMERNIESYMICFKWNFQVPRPGIEPGTLHFKAQYSTTRPSREKDEPYKLMGLRLIG